jgi:hypothetical protein
MQQIVTFQEEAVNENPAQAKNLFLRGTSCINRTYAKLRD